MSGTVLDPGTTAIRRTDQTLCSHFREAILYRCREETSQGPAWMTQGKFLNLSVTRFPYLSIGVSKMALACRL